ncbi:MAG: hypothetical protein WCH65_06975 [bacterium]
MVQEIFETIHRALYPENYISRITKKEKNFISNFNSFNAKTGLQIGLKTAADGRNLLVWYSKTEKNIVCPIHLNAFIFSQTGVLKKKTITEISICCSMEEINVIKNEIEDIKKLLTTYMIGNENYFQ